MEQVLQQFKDRISAATAGGSALQIRGGGTKDWYGQTPQGDVLDTRAYTGIIDYDPTELVITARCGTPLAEIDAALAQQGQMLAFEPPHFGRDATIGGAVASGMSGPRRQAVGALRDFMLGAVLMDGKGEVLHFGGQVMKNVAGYDVSRLLSGSLGTLGLLLEVSVKVLPKALAESSIRLAMSQADALHHLNTWGGQPLPISASAWHDGGLTVRLSGADAAVKAAKQKMGGEVLADADADAFWSGLREQTTPFFTAAINSAAGLWRLSVPSVTAPLDLPGQQCIEWGGAQRWLAAEIDAARLRTIVEKIGGHATLFRGGDKQAGVFHPLTSSVAGIHRRLKQSFDPAGIFNPGRMYPDL